MIILRKPGETDEQYFARVAELNKSLGFGSVPAGWPKAPPSDDEEEKSEEEQDDA